MHRILTQVSDAEPQHRAINSCLRPVCALGGVSITTIEGTGATRRPNPELLTHSLVGTRSAAPLNAAVPPSIQAASLASRLKRDSVLSAVKQANKMAVGAPSFRVQPAPINALPPSEVSHDGVNPVAYRLAVNNGSQCGYCSVGIVMNMTEFLIRHPNATKKNIEDALDGNLCRCTGYRSILTGLKTFASDWSSQDEEGRMKCLLGPKTASQLPADLSIPLVTGAPLKPQPVNADSGKQRWLTAMSLVELRDILTQCADQRCRLVYGNTSFGVYQAEYSLAEVLIDIRFIPELQIMPKINDGLLMMGAGVTYADLISYLESEAARPHTREGLRLGTLLHMARRTAGRIVRNAASLGGNTAMVLSHIVERDTEPFPSDLATALEAVDARVIWLNLEPKADFEYRRTSIAGLAELVQADPRLLKRFLIVGYEVPVGSPEVDVAVTQKVALREVNSHSIVNLGVTFCFDADNRMLNVRLVLGGIAPYPWHAAATERALIGQRLSLDLVATTTSVLAEEVASELGRWATRYAHLRTDGVTSQYRIDLATGLIFKAFVFALLEKGVSVPPQLESVGEMTWGKGPVSDGRQFFAPPQRWKAPVGQPYIKVTAIDQASGQIHYTQELPTPLGTLQGAFVQSRRAQASFRYKLPHNDRNVSASELRSYLLKAFPAIVDFITYENIRDGGINMQGVAHDQPLLAQGEVFFVGQAIALAIAATEQDAIEVAQFIENECLTWDVLGWPAPFDRPIIGLADAIAANSIFPDYPASASYVSHIWKVTRPGSVLDWVVSKPPLESDASTRHQQVGGASCLIVDHCQRNGGQAHFYLETQAAIVQPIDEQCFKVQTSTQSPMAMLQTTAMALGIHYNRLDLQLTSIGGGFGGKTEPARFVVGPTAVAAQAMKRPVRVAVPREQDTLMIGKRHAYYGQYQIAIDVGDRCAADRGLLKGFFLKLWGDGGAFYDCSFIVSNCIQLRTDNAYFIPNFESQIDVCRTNTAPSTAMRAFGDVQGTNIVENAIDDAAFALGMRPEEVRERNLYRQGDATPFGQALSFCYMRQVWNYLKQVSGYETKRASVEKFNKENRWRKQGLAMLPVKYGSGYNLLLLEQATVVLSVSQGDGSIIVHQGGAEMGQGLITQVQQVAAYVLNVPLELVFVESARTNINPNATSTGASTGTPYNCEAVRRTCRDLRTRLTSFAQTMREENGDSWCVQNGIDFWNYPEGWARVREFRGAQSTMWQTLVAMAYSNRVSLIAVFNAEIKGGETPVPTMTYKPLELQPKIPGVEASLNPQQGGIVNSFVGFTYSAALAVVEVDVLTGETTILSTDIVYDIGWSMNPAIDVGQVEGAFVQGVGYLLTEKLVFQESGAEVGRLNSTNTWDYKIPAVSSIPKWLNTHLFPRDSVAEIPEDPNDIFSAKEVGEPPLVLANCVFFAVKDAIRSSRLERRLSGLFRFDAPATVQEVRRACEASPAEFSSEGIGLDLEI